MRQLQHGQGHRARAESSTGVDVAQPVIHTKKRNHVSERVLLVRADLTRDVLPPADAAIVRQVLQHLTNTNVVAALGNTARTYSLAVVTEHIYSGRSTRSWI
jgi:hypothetical protein